MFPIRDEKEFRLLFWKPDPTNSAVGVGTNGVRVNVDLNKLIESIYVSPRLKAIPDDLVRLVEAKPAQDAVNEGNRIAREKRRAREKLIDDRIPSYLASGRHVVFYGEPGRATRESPIGRAD